MSDSHGALLIGSDAAAEKLGVSTRQIRNLVYRRQIPFVKVGRLVRFNPNELDRWIAANSHSVEVH